MVLRAIHGSRSCAIDGAAGELLGRGREIVPFGATKKGLFAPSQLRDLPKSHWCIFLRLRCSRTI